MTESALDPRDSPKPGRGDLRPMSAGVVSSLVAFSSSFVVVLTGLAAVGASPDEASSGLLALSVTMGLACIALAVSTRLPVTVAWSTPGAALLAATGMVEGGWPAAVGAFIVTGVLILLTGLIPWLGALIGRIPSSVAQAMLAGILFQLSLGPVTGLAANPIAVAPVIVVWLIALRFAARWATPVALLAAIVVITIFTVVGGTGIPADALAPRIVFTAPEFTVGAIVSIAIPLFIVTMASQNIPGVAVMKGLGFEVPWRRSMLVTGAGTVVGAAAGGHAINLAAISAALAAGPEAGEDRSRRWIASVTAGCLYLVFGVGAAAFAALILLAPAGVIPAVAGLALLGTLAASLQAALAEPRDRIPAVVAFATAASGVAVAGLTAAFLALIAGLLVRAVLSRRH